MDEEQQRVRAEVAATVKRTGVTLTELARRANIAPSTLTRFMNRADVKHTLSTRTLAAIRRAAALPAHQGLDPSEAVLPAPDVTLPEPRPEGPRDVPVYGAASCGTDGAFVINMQDAPVDYLPRPAALVRASGIFAVFVQGSSMEPLFRHGEAVFCQDRRPYGANDAVLVQLEAERGEPPLAFIKVFVKASDERLVLRQLNPPEEMELERTEVRKIWRVLHPRELG